jgi:hypothetical protein
MSCTCPDGGWSCPELPGEVLIGTVLEWVFAAGFALLLLAVIANSTN